jgi:hypothetical protein
LLAAAGRVSCCKINITHRLWVKTTFLGCPTSRRLVAFSFTRLLAVTLALLSGGFQLAVAFRVDLLLTPRQRVLRRNVAMALFRRTLL